MSFETRYDGTKFPCREADSAVLREETESGAQTALGFAYQRTLADLVIDMLAGGDLVQSGDRDPENWVTLENTMLKNAALEVKALSSALDFTTNETSIADEFTQDEITHLMRALSRRMTAGAELAQRLRAARWGHPSFGGGENWAKPQTVEAKPEAAE